MGADGRGAAGREGEDPARLAHRPRHQGDERSDGRVDYFAIASEDPKLHEPVPPGRAPWREVAKGAVVGVDADLRLCRATLTSVDAL